MQTHACLAMGDIRRGAEAEKRKDVAIKRHTPLTQLLLLEVALVGHIDFQTSKNFVTYIYHIRHLLELTTQVSSDCPCTSQATH